MIPYNEAKNYVHDSSGIENPDLWMWEKVNGIFYPVKGTENHSLKSDSIYTIESAKQFLKDNGYFVDNLWSVHDVKSKYECSEEQAQTVLNDVLSGEWLCGEVNASIDISADAYNLTKRVSKYCLCGFCKNVE